MHMDCARPTQKQRFALHQKKSKTRHFVMKQSSSSRPKASVPLSGGVLGRSPITFDRFIRGLIGLIVIGGLGALIYYLSSVLIPFFVAWVVAYLLYPVVRFFQYKCRIRNRLVAIMLTLLLTCGAIAGFFYLVVPPMIEEITHLKDVALEYVQKGANNNNTIPPVVQQFFRSHAAEYNVEHILRQQDVIAAVKNTVPKVWNVLWSTASILINVAASLIALLYLLFLLTDYEKYANSWISFIPRNRRAFAAQLVSDIEHGMAGYFRGQALVALSNCVMFSIGFLVIGFPMPIGLGCLIGVISFVPYLQVVGFLPAGLLALLKAAETGENFWWLLLLVLAVYLVVQILQDTIFTPRIMGKIMGLPPAIILLSLSVWGYALGIIGLIIALPVTTLMISYYRRYVVGTTQMDPTNLSSEDVEVERAAGVYVESPDKKKENTPQAATPNDTTSTETPDSVPDSTDTSHPEN